MYKLRSQRPTREDLGSSLEPGGLSEGDSGVLGQQLGGEAPQSSEHGLQLPRPSRHPSPGFLQHIKQKRTPTPQLVGLPALTF